MNRPVACIYRHPDNSIFQVRIVTGKAVTTIPVENSLEKTVRKAVYDMFGPCQWLDVTVYPSEAPEDNPPPIQIDLDRW